jgi:hypothetical protein
MEEFISKEIIDYIIMPYIRNPEYDKVMKHIRELSVIESCCCYAEDDNMKVSRKILLRFYGIKLWKLKPFSHIYPDHITGRNNPFDVI